MKTTLLREVSPLSAKVLACAMTLLILSLDYGLPGDVNSSIFYVCVVVVSAWTQSTVWLWSNAVLAGFLAIFHTAVPVGNAPVGHDVLNAIDLTNRYITASMLIVAAAFVQIGVRLRRQLDANERLMTEIAARERALTERNLAREMLSQAQADFAHAARIAMLGELTASIAHELGQPIAAIATNCETGIRWLDREQPDLANARKVLRRIPDDIVRCSDIITRVRRMAAGRAPVRAKVSIDEIILEAIEFLGYDIRMRAVHVRPQLAASGHDVFADRIQLQQVIVNLVVNAMQAVEHAGKSEGQITIRTTLPDAFHVCCAVEDSGGGIPPEHLLSLFDKIFTTKANGMGMGLRIARTIVEAHGGKIEADNESVHGGARFRFTLPLCGEGEG